jgi:hypothetical protein
MSYIPDRGVTTQPYSHAIFKPFGKAAMKLSGQTFRLGAIGPTLTYNFGSEIDFSNPLITAYYSRFDSAPLPKLDYVNANKFSRWANVEHNIASDVDTFLYYRWPVMLPEQRQATNSAGQPLFIEDPFSDDGFPLMVGSIKNMHFELSDIDCMILAVVTANMDFELGENAFWYCTRKGSTYGTYPEIINRCKFELQTAEFKPIVEKLAQWSSEVNHEIKQHNVDLLHLRRNIEVFTAIGGMIAITAGVFIFAAPPVAAVEGVAGGVAASPGVILGPTAPGVVLGPAAPTIISAPVVAAPVVAAPVVGGVGAIASIGAGKILDSVINTGGDVITDIIKGDIDKKGYESGGNTQNNNETKSDIIGPILIGGGILAALLFL